MRALIPLAVLCLPAHALAEPTAEDPCPLTEARVAEVTGMKVPRKKLRPFTFVMIPRPQNCRPSQYPSSAVKR